MKYIKSGNEQAGFLAFTSTFILMFSLFFFSLITFRLSYEVYDYINLHQVRIQAYYNLNFCFDYAKLMLSKDYFLMGDYYIEPFDCKLNFINNEKEVTVNASTTFANKTFGGKKILQRDRFFVR